MRSQWVVGIAFVVTASLLSGCNSADPDAPLSQPGSAAGSSSAEVDPASPVVADTPPASPLEPAGSDTAAPTVEEPAPEAADPEVAASDSPQPVEEEMDRVKADVGVAKAGRSLDEYEGVVVTPAKSLFAVKERMVFQVQIPSALKLYNATNGYDPKSHEEFMAKIVEANQIQLPELPAGQRYRWDPEQGELMVEKPR